MYHDYMLDSDILSYAIAGSSPILRRRLLHISPGRIAVSAVSAAELLYGVRALPAAGEIALAVNRFLTQAHILAWDLSAAQAYADIRRSLTLSAQLIGELDMMIAAHAIAIDATLVTNNFRHFSRLAPPLRLENWAEPAA